MTENVPIVLVPSLNGSARLYAPQIPELWRLGPVMIADHTRDDTMAAIAERILASARRAFTTSAFRWAAIWHSKSCGRRRSAS